MPAPVISGVNPTSGTAITVGQSIGFTVTSGTGLLRVFVSATLPGIGITEVVHDGTSFVPAYAPASSRTAVSGGFSYAIRRAPSWPDAPTVTVYAEDTAGLETVASFAWPLTMPPPLPPPATVPSFPTTGAASQAPVVQHDQAYFLAFFDRNFDAGWLAPLKNTPQSGYETLQAFAAVGARLSAAVANLERGNVIVYASGGSKAAGLVEFYRGTATAGAVTIAAGTIVTTSDGGRDFMTTQPAAFGPSDVGPIAVGVIAVAQGWQWNVPGTVVTARGEVLPGAIDTIKSFVQLDPASVLPSPTFLDGTIQVKQVADTTGGADPMLDGLGADRGMVRRSGETDPAYRLRIRTLPDTVSKDAIVRQVTAFLLPYGASAQFIETFEQDYQSCWDAATGMPPGPDFDNLFVYDDPRPAFPFANRWLDDVEFRGAFIVVVPNFPTLRDYGSPWDDTAVDVAATILPSPTNGQRALAAYDLTTTPPGGLPWCWDGFDSRKQAVYAALWELLQQLKAAGVSAILELQGQ